MFILLPRDYDAVLHAYMSSYLVYCEEGEAYDMSELYFVDFEDCCS